MSRVTTTWNASVGARLGLGLSIENSGDLGLAGDLSVSGGGLSIDGDSFELHIDPQLFVSGNIVPDADRSRTLVGGGVEVSASFGRYSFNAPVIRAGVGVGAGIRSLPSASPDVSPGVRVSLGVDIPILSSGLDLGRWLSPQISYVDGGTELTLGVRGQILPSP